MAWADEAARTDAAAGAFFGDVAFLDERLIDRADDFIDFLAGDKSGHVEDVRAQVAVHAAAGELALESPGQRHAGLGPILQVRGADLINPTELPFLDELVR